MTNTEGGSPVPGYETMAGIGRAESWQTGAGLMDELPCGSVLTHPEISKHNAVAKRISKVLIKGQGLYKKNENVIFSYVTTNVPVINSG